MEKLKDNSQDNIRQSIKLELIELDQLKVVEYDESINPDNLSRMRYPVMNLLESQHLTNGPK